METVGAPHTEGSVLLMDLPDFAKVLGTGGLGLGLREIQRAHEKPGMESNCVEWTAYMYRHGKMPMLRVQEGNWRGSDSRP